MAAVRLLGGDPDQHQREQADEERCRRSARRALDEQEGDEGEDEGGGSREQRQQLAADPAHARYQGRSQRLPQYCPARRLPQGEHSCPGGTTSPGRVTNWFARKPLSARPPQDDVEGAGAAVARVGIADRGDAAGMARRGEPVADRRADPAARGRPLAAGRLAGDQEEQPRAAGDRRFEPAVEQIVGGREVVAVQVEHHVGLDQAAGKPPVPAPVERRRRALAAARAPARAARPVPRRFLARALVPRARDRRRRPSAAGARSGRTLSTTLSHNAVARQGRGGASSRARVPLGRSRTGSAAALHAAGDRGPRPRPAPQKVSKRLAPLIAPPVSWAIHRPLASAGRARSSTGAPSGTKLGSAATVRSRRDRQAERAERPGAGQLLEEDVALVLAHDRPPLLGMVAKPGDDALHAGLAGAEQAALASSACRCRHIRGRSARHSRSA